VLRPDRELLCAWLLLFLAHGSGYGYGLAQQLRDENLDVEMTVAYRVLRALERDGNVSSRWIESPAGPRRRLYSLTAAGRRALDVLVLAVMRTRDHYCDFAEMYEHRARRRRPAAAGDAVGSHPEQQLTTGWVLLLIDGGVSYGYDLRRHLATHDLEPDPGRMYRLLRQLDDRGWLRSRWSDPTLGPRRRVYAVTAAGRRGLHEIAELLRRASDVHRAFADAYEHIDDDYRGPSIPRRARR